MSVLGSCSACFPSANPLLSDTSPLVPALLPWTKGFLLLVSSGHFLGPIPSTIQTPTLSGHVLLGRQGHREGSRCSGLGNASPAGSLPSVPLCSLKIWSTKGPESFHSKTIIQAQLWVGSPRADIFYCFLVTCREPALCNTAI